MKTLPPHLERAPQYRRCQAGGAALEGYSAQVLDVLGVAVVLLDAHLNVLHANAAALRLFSPQAAACPHAPPTAGLRWQVAPQLCNTVRAVIAQAGPHCSACQSLRLPRANATHLTLTVAPFQAATGPHARSRCALLLAQDPDACAMCAPALQQLFALTPSEAQICQALARGHAIGDIASHCGVTASTVKTHLHHVYGKTGTRRQGELVALIHQCVCSLPHTDAKPA